MKISGLFRFISGAFFHRALCRVRCRGGPGIRRLSGCPALRVSRGLSAFGLCRWCMPPHGVSRPQASPARGAACVTWPLCGLWLKCACIADCNNCGISKWGRTRRASIDPTNEQGGISASFRWPFIARRDDEVGELASSRLPLGPHSGGPIRNSTKSRAEVSVRVRADFKSGSFEYRTAA